MKMQILILINHIRNIMVAKFVPFYNHSFYKNTSKWGKNMD
jgi:hypothetical protein